MKIFPKNSSENSRAPRKALERLERSENDKPINKKKLSSPIKKDLSASAIREKLASHVETSDVAKNMAIKKTKQFGQNFMSDSIKPIVDVNLESNESNEIPEKEIKTPNSSDFTLNSDIANNDPKDTNTQEKLKSALSRGAFNFNPKEREALEKILGS